VDVVETLTPKLDDDWHYTFYAVYPDGTRAPLEMKVRVDSRRFLRKSWRWPHKKTWRRRDA
jgi:hypothetical protein